MQESGLDLFDADPEDEPESIPDANDTKTRRKWLRRVMIAFATVIALIVGVAGFYVVVGVQALQSIKREPGLMPTENATNPLLDDGPVNFILIGSDSRGADRGRSDTLMIAHLNAEHNALYLISIPRDSYVDIPGHGKNKVNAAYSFGGAPLAITTVQNLTGARMDHTAIIDFEGFIGLTSDVGGVTIFNEIASSNLGFTFPRGEITISGEQALAYVRQRHNLPRGDFDRAARQRVVVRALILKLMNPTTLANPATFHSVAGKLGKYVTVDDRLTNDAIWSLASNNNIRSARAIRQLQVPIARGAMIKGSSVQIIDTKRMAEFSAALRTDQLESYWATYGED